jgi:hypothetical protein
MLYTLSFSEYWYDLYAYRNTWCYEEIYMLPMGMTFLYSRNCCLVPVAFRSHRQQTGIYALRELPAGNHHSSFLLIKRSWQFRPWILSRAYQRHSFSFLLILTWRKAGSTEVIYRPGLLIQVSERAVFPHKHILGRFLTASCILSACLQLYYRSQSLLSERYVKYDTWFPQQVLCTISHVPFFSFHISY